MKTVSTSDVPPPNAPRRTLPAVVSFETVGEVIAALTSLPMTQGSALTLNTSNQPAATRSRSTTNVDTNRPVML